ncbi:DUF5009 domain-containing protein [Glaciecola sp. MH2013]|uniref:acyltransferase family protein n=1 Tax=Glaciecola sp. MH2013 TaxID=2785524 RepID=UPI00189C9269|nr:DUF5009 domain-containing protein [Glaciecola sp. MH2013]MBF7074372.1 DUF5009 domain-containing protein [Glaciecola sp. MH2013]
MESRLDELDLLRGISVIGMILVITPGAWGVSYPWLNHADWEGVVAVDMIAPAFMFCIGFAIPLSLKNRIAQSFSTSKIALQIIRRGGLLVLLGVFINWTGSADLASLRLPGVLQRIGVTFIAVSLLVLFVGRKSDCFAPSIKQLFVITFVLLTAAWLLFYLVPVPGGQANEFGPVNSWASVIDRSVFSVAHMWEWGQTNGVVTYDPDGIMCSVTTCANVLFGTILGVMYQQKNIHYTKRKLIVFGVALIALGLAFSFVCPIIKKIWTSSFVLVSSGVSVIAFVILWSIKTHPFVNRLLHPAYAYGANALFGFTVSWLGLFWFLDLSLFGELSLRTAGFNALNAVFESKAMASLMFALVFIALLYAVLAFMNYKRWYVRL